MTTENEKLPEDESVGEAMQQTRTSKDAPFLKRIKVLEDELAGIREAFQGLVIMIEDNFGRLDQVEKRAADAMETVGGLRKQVFSEGAEELRRRLKRVESLVQRGIMNEWATTTPRGNLK